MPDMHEKVTLGLIAACELLCSAGGRVLCNVRSDELRQVRKEAAVIGTTCRRVPGHFCVP